MAAYIRRFTNIPELDVLVEIESVNILDLEPSAAITSVGFGTSLLVGEFEDGPYNEPTEVFGVSDLFTTFGSFGFTYDGVVSNNPCARGRKADGAVLFERWNGNGAIALNGKKFSRLIICRVDTSVGEVQFNRCASLNGVAKPAYRLADSQTLVFDIGGGNVTCTFDGNAAVYSGAVFPGGGGNSGFTGGEWVDVSYDKLTAFRVTFLAADQTPAQVAARINLAAGFTFASVNAGGVRLTGRKGGTEGQVNVVAANAAGTLTAMGWATGTTAGTGNVKDINAVTIAEAHTAVHLASASVSMGMLTDGTPVLYNSATPGTGTIQVDVTSTAVDFGFATEVTAEAATGIAGVIPAGTVVKNAGGDEWVTCQTVTVSADDASYDVKVRHAKDDGTGAGANVATVVVLPDVLPVGAFTVTNVQPLTAAKTESEIDAAYETAFDSTLDLNSIAKEAQIVWCARQSNVVRRKGKANAIAASESGMYGRRFVMRPPQGTSRTVAKGTAEPGVGAYRHERVYYTYPSAVMYVKGIATRGTAGGDGFTADGVVVGGADGFLVSTMSQLPPYENPGQENDYLDNVLGIEPGAHTAGWTMADYKSFKANGIVALRMVSGKAYFQSGVTSVNPTTHPGLVPISRRNFADVMQDTLALRASKYSKKLNTRARWAALLADTRNYLTDLLSPNDESRQRIGGFTLTPAGTTAMTAQGVRWMVARVQTLGSMDSIVIQCEMGNEVTITAQ